MHWSRLAAERTLRALRRFGGEATTAELQAITGSMAVHTDIASLRVYLERVLGLSKTDVETCYAGRTESGRQAYSYRLTPAAMFAREPETATA